MTGLRNSSGLFAIVLALGEVACTTDDDVEDLGPLVDDKSDTVLPRRIEVEIAEGDSKRFRIKTDAFVASLADTEDVDAQLTAKHYSFNYSSDESPAPQIDVTGDGTLRNWTLTVYNRGNDTLDATLVVDVPGDHSELGIVSDIDKTVLPPETSAGMPPPYPGIASMLSTLELRGSGNAGDIHYVTARDPADVVVIPDWMAMHAVPAGSIDTGVGTQPWVAQPEKVRDIKRIMDGRDGQKFVLFGDTSHRDPEVYKEVRTLFPDRVLAIFIHKVNATVSPTRVAGMHLVNNYAEAAAIAFGLDLITEAEARSIMNDAKAEGLAITAAEINALIAAQP
jgi:hypothetical protein